MSWRAKQKFAAGWRPATGAPQSGPSSHFGPQFEFEFGRVRAGAGAGSGASACANVQFDFQPKGPGAGMKIQAAQKQQRPPRAEAQTRATYASRQIRSPLESSSCSFPPPARCRRRRRPSGRAPTARPSASSPSDRPASWPISVPLIFVSRASPGGESSLEGEFLQILCA